MIKSKSEIIEEPLSEIVQPSRKKYTPKKCEHNKRKDLCVTCKGSSTCIHLRIKRLCKDCVGSAFCSHLRRKQICKECNGKDICIHDKVKYNCKECNGSAYCSHGIQKSNCKKCGGSSICIHDKIKHVCKECKGSVYCIHEHIKYTCVTCRGSSICIHDKIKSKCKDCNGSLYCIHKCRKNRCKLCQGSSICIHLHQKDTCKQCHGSLVCKHDMLKYACLTCTPSNACQHCKSINASRSNWKPYCFRCYCVLNPDAVIPRKYKLKEHHVVDALKAHFKEQITMIFDKPVEGGCSKKRPDVSIDFGSHCLMIEIDENRHVNYSCEERRMVELYEDIGFRKIIFLRFNPDGYKEGTHKYISPFRYTRSGILNLEETEFNRRIAQLIERIHAHCLLEPTEQITVEYMFYGDEG